MISIEKVNYFNEQGIVMTNNNLEALLIPNWGSHLIRLRLRDTNTDILRTPNSLNEYKNSPFLFGIPILFPPNRIVDGIFTFNHYTYHFDITEHNKHNHLHGLVYNLPWNLTSIKLDENRIDVWTEFDSTLHPNVLRQFPHPFTITMHYMLEDLTLTMEATIVNQDTSPFPWGFGYHTTFNVPFRNMINSKNSSILYVPARRQWQLTERLVPSGKLIESPLLSALNEGINPNDYKLDDLFLASTNDETNKAILSNEIDGVAVIYSCKKGFTQWTIYNQDGKQDFISVEPYTWVTNAPNLALPDCLTGFQVLNPGCQVSLQCDLKVVTNDISSIFPAEPSPQI